jgi:hypothetical protein
MTAKPTRYEGRRFRAVARAVEACRAAGMTDTSLMIAGFRRADLSAIEAAKGKPAKPEWQPGQAPTIDAIVRTFVEIADCGVTLDELKAETTVYRIAWPRVVAVWCVRTILQKSAPYPAIADYFGRDHSTIMHAYKRAGPKIMRRVHWLADVADKVRAKFEGDLIK